MRPFAASAPGMNEALPPVNPLLDLSGLPRFRSVRPEHVRPALDQLLARNRAERVRLLAALGEPDWNDIVQPLADLDEELDRVWSLVSHLNAVCNGEWRDVFNEGVTRVSEYRTELHQDRDLYRAYRHIAEGAGFMRLQQAQRKIVENALRDFRLGGAELADRERQRLREIERELATLGSHFADNVLDATHAWALELEEESALAGLPEGTRALARAAAEREGKRGYRFTLDAPTYTVFMAFADDRRLRERMYEAYVTRASAEGPHAGRWDNSDIIRRVLLLRREAAHLLGFQSYAEYSLQRKMVKRVAEVLAFLRGLGARARPAAERELAELGDFARSQHGLPQLQPWDVAYYAEKLRQQRYEFSQEDLRPYFPAEHVLGGVFAIAERLYGLRFVQADGVETWHPDVRFYELRDEGGALRGRFYVDLYARARKRGGAWMDECINRKRTAAGLQTPVAHLVCNATPPLPERPALLTHAEVITLLHEFGHALQHLLTTVDYPPVAGINGVPWDAVELASQFMENWGWQREGLDLLAHHHRTGQRLPAALYTRLARARNFHSALQMVRQLEFALFDMRLHSDYDPEGGQSVQGLLDEVRREVAVIVPPAYNRFQNAFTHIFAGGYAAGYYSYKWSEVLSADAFGKFEENGVFDRATGLAFLHNILEPGGTREPLELFVAFRGRAPRVDALLRHAGLI